MGDDAEPDGMTSDPTESEPATRSNIHGVARSIVGMFGDEQQTQELDDTVSALAPSGMGADGMDALISAGLAVGASRAEIRRSMRDRQTDAHGELSEGGQMGPLLQAREIENESGEFVGLRVFVDASPADIDVYRGEKALLVRTPDGELEQPLGFHPQFVDDVSESGDIAEYMVRPPADADTEDPDPVDEDDEDPEDDDTEEE